MKKLLGAIVFFTCSFAGFSQQDYQFTQFFNDRVSLNPAAAGMGDRCLGLFFREQWSGFSGNPSTLLLNYDMPVKILKGGVGITAYNDVLGNQKLGQTSSNPGAGIDGNAITTNAVRLHYSYHLQNVGPGKLGFGLSLGYQGAKVGGDWFAIDGVVNDDAIPNNEDSRGGADFSFGMFYKTQKFWAGLSSTHLSAPEIDGNDFDFSVARHYYFMTGYEAQLNSDWRLLPSLMVKSDAVSTSIDANVRAEWNNFLWFGVSGRTLVDAVSPMAGVNWQLNSTSTFEHSIKFGYSYDVTLSEIKNFSSGSHEIFLGYCFKPIELIIRKKHSNPRFL